MEISRLKGFSKKYLRLCTTRGRKQNRWKGGEWKKKQKKTENLKNYEKSQSRESERNWSRSLGDWVFDLQRLLKTGRSSIIQYKWGGIKCEDGWFHASSPTGQQLNWGPRESIPIKIGKRSPVKGSCVHDLLLLKKCSSKKDLLFYWPEICYLSYNWSLTTDQVLAVTWIGNFQWLFAPKLCYSSGSCVFLSHVWKCTMIPAENIQFRNEACATFWGHILLTVQGVSKRKNSFPMQVFQTSCKYYSKVLQFEDRLFWSFQFPED